MKRNAKKTLSLLLTIALFFSAIVPYSEVPAFAADGDSDVTAEYLENYLNSLNFTVDPNNMQMFDLSALQATTPIPGDVLTLSGGSVGADGRYIISVGSVDEYRLKRFPLTISRPKGNEADYPVSVDLHISAHTGGMAYSAKIYSNESSYNENDMIETLVFEAEESTKTVYIDFSFAASGGGGQGIETFFLHFSNPYRAAAEYPLVQLNFNRNGNINGLNSGYDPQYPPGINIATPMFSGVYEVGDYIPLGVEYGGGMTYVNITSGQALTLKHSDNSEITLTPVETGTIGNRATFLYPLSEIDLVREKDQYGGRSLDAEFVSLNGVEIYGTSDTLNYTPTDNVNCNFDLSNGFAVTTAEAAVEPVTSLTRHSKQACRFLWAMSHPLSLHITLSYAIRKPCVLVMWQLTNGSGGC